MLFPMLTAESLHLALYFSTEYRDSRQNIIIVFLRIFLWYQKWGMATSFLRIHTYIVGWEMEGVLEPKKTTEKNCSSSNLAYQAVL